MRALKLNYPNAFYAPCLNKPLIIFFLDGSNLDGVVVEGQHLDVFGSGEGRSGKG